MLSIERNGSVMVATLCRPPVNAINDELAGALDAALKEVEADKDISVLHIRSDQKAFCAGADLALLHARFATPQGPDEMTKAVRGVQGLFARIEAAPVVTVAEIHATAMGGGLELALACDIRIAAHEAKLGLTEIRLGLLPGGGGTQRLTKLCGPGIASRLILSGEVISGEEAERLGIVQWSRPRAELAAFTREVVGRFADSPRTAVTLNKSCIALAAPSSKAGYEQELAGTRRLYDDPESRGRVAQFITKSKAG